MENGPKKDQPTPHQIIADWMEHFEPIHHSAGYTFDKDMEAASLELAMETGGLVLLPATAELKHFDCLLAALRMLFPPLMNDGPRRQIDNCADENLQAAILDIEAQRVSNATHETLKDIQERLHKARLLYRMAAYGR